MADVEKLIEKLEEDDDVMNVYHTMEELISQLFIKL
jgi:transcriptional/translational regulatory protein YebC/TACO1